MAGLVIQVIVKVDLLNALIGRREFDYSMYLSLPVKRMKQAVSDFTMSVYIAQYPFHPPSLDVAADTGEKPPYGLVEISTLLPASSNRYDAVVGAGDNWR